MATTLLEPISAMDTANWIPCRLCGVLYVAGGDDNQFCEDCELSDCAYCGFTTNRPLLSCNLACQMCEGEVA